MGVIKRIAHWGDKDLQSQISLLKGDNEAFKADKQLGRAISCGALCVGILGGVVANCCTYLAIRPGTSASLATFSAAGTSSFWLPW